MVSRQWRWELTANQGADSFEFLGVAVVDHNLATFFGTGFDQYGGPEPFTEPTFEFEQVGRLGLAVRTVDSNGSSTCRGRYPGGNHRFGLRQ